MKYLIDTHVIIWYLEDSTMLPPVIFGNMESNKNTIYISAVSLWEIALKVSIGKLKLKLSLDEFLNKVEQYKFNILQMENNCLKRLVGLPHIHKDPFDRLLVATALAKDLAIITKDENIHKYDVKWAW